MATLTLELQAVQRLADEGNMGELADRVLRNAVAHGGLENRLIAEQLDVVLRLPDACRLRLVTKWAARHREGTDTEKVRETLLLLVQVAGRGLGGDLLAGERIARLTELARRHSSWYGVRPDLLAEAELTAGRTLAPEVVAFLRRSAAGGYGGRPSAALLKRLTEPVLNPGEQWADAALETAAARGAEWTRLLRHAVTATSVQPSAAWEKQGRELIDAIGTEQVGTAVRSWFTAVGRPRTFRLDPDPYGPDANHLFDPYNANALRGLTWLLVLLPSHPDTPRALGGLVETALRKAPGIGPRSPKVANAAALALSRAEGEAAPAELARLATRVTYKGTLKVIESALEKRAAALGLSREEVEELAVPAYGLTEVGLLPHEHGELAVRGGRAVLGWRNAAGKQVKGVPAAVKRDHAEEVAALKAAAKDIDKMLTAQAERLDRQFLARRSWAHPVWRERFLDHPLVGTLARRLLWTVDGRACGWADGALRTLTDDPLGAVGEAATVELWHPVDRDPAEIMAWREWLERHGVTQPFKQAHREVYLLTEAERTTRTYSNRFAGHFLRQHQFHSLAAVRGWRNKLRLMVDDTYPPAIRELPAWGLRAEFWVDGVGDGYGEDITESGSYLRIGTDQVRFYPLDAPGNRAQAGSGDYRHDWQETPPEALPLADVPALVLSEVLRDVDLFVGVASVGNDPTWQDGGPEGRFRAYWHDFGFGELSQSARGRADLLARLVPRLAVADRCSIEGRFLHVRGDLHTYKIHLGSGNILIAPHDRYLCIVPKATPTTAATGYDGYLPFDGDRALAVILSKALLLARDTEITDRAITSQL